MCDVCIKVFNKLDETLVELQREFPANVEEFGGKAHHITTALKTAAYKLAVSAIVGTDGYPTNEELQAAVDAQKGLGNGSLAYLPDSGITH